MQRPHRIDDLGTVAIGLVGADDLVAAERRRGRLHARPQRLCLGVVAGADQVLIALVEVLGVDAVTHVDAAGRRELPDVAGAHLVDAEADGAVVGVDGGADEDDVGKRLDRAADRDVDERLAPWRRRLLLGGRDGGEGDSRGGREDECRDAPDHDRQRRAVPRPTGGHPLTSSPTSPRSGCRRSRKPGRYTPRSLRTRARTRRRARR